MFLISDPDNEYYCYIRDAYGTRVVTASTHISIGLNDAETIVRAARLLRLLQHRDSDPQPRPRNRVRTGYPV